MSPPDLGPKLVHARHGDLFAYPTDTYLGEAVCKMGEYGEREYQFLRDVLEGYEHVGSSIVEVGANAGYLTVPLMRHGHVHAFEPQPAVFKLLVDNVHHNTKSEEGGYSLQPLAVGNSIGEVECPDIPYSIGINHGGISMNTPGGYPMVKVPCTTLDSVYNIDPARGDGERTFWGGSPVKLVKVDVEGMEEKVLRGGRQLIARDQPILYVENDRMDLSSSLIRYVWSLGYWCAFHLPPLYNPDNFFHNKQNPWGNVVSINMVCVPKGKRLPAGVAVKHGLQLVEDAEQHPMKVSA